MTTTRARLTPYLLALFLSISLATPYVFAQNPVSFVAPRDYPAPAIGNSVAVADFNQDGRLDIATAGPVLAQSEISLLLQNSDGSYAAAQTFTAGNAVMTIVAGDFNHDGKPDLLSLDRMDANVSVLLGNGDGTFQAPKLTTIPSGQPLPFVNGPGIAVGDFNGDGIPDFAVIAALAQVNTFAVVVMLGNGDGTFHAEAQQYPVASLMIVAGDVNGDGKIDLVAVPFSNSPGALSEVFLGNGDGTFQSAISTPGNIGSPVSLFLGDVNGDGKLDLIEAFPHPDRPNIGVAFGNGDGTFQAPIGFPLTTLYDGIAAVADLNGDGKADLLVSLLSTVTILISNGDGTFKTGATIGATNLAWQSPAPTAVADLAGNGQLSVVIAAQVVSVTTLNSDGTAQGSTSYNVPDPSNFGNYLQSLVTADLNGDGKPDFATVSQLLNSEGARLASLLNTGSSFSNPIFDLSFLTCCGIGVASSPIPTGLIATADFNGDGKVDLALADPQTEGGTSIGILLGNGDGTFQAEADYGAQMEGPIAVGDFNGDNKLDVIGVIPDFGAPTPLAVLLGNGDGTFGFPVTTTTGQVITALVTGDFNGDKNLDVATLTSTSTPAVNLQIFYGNGDGTFTAGPAYNAGDDAATIAAGDLNGDGATDLVVATGIGLNSQVFVFVGKGDGTFNAPLTTTYNGSTASPFLAIADFNGDGKPDLAVSNSGTNDISILVGNGDGTFQEPLNFGITSGPMAVADFNGDGSPDIATANGPNIYVTLNRPFGPAATLSTSSLALGNVATGSSSSPQSVTLTNTSSSSVSIAAVTVTGPQSSEFTVNNGCGSSVAAGAQCTIRVTFTPAAVGSRTATLSVTTNAWQAARTVALSGTGVSLGLASTNPKASVSPGQTATYSMTLGGAGFAGTVNLTCTGAPATVTCTVPATETVNGSTTVTFNVTVATTAPTVSGLRMTKPPLRSNWTVTLVLAGVLLLPGISKIRLRRLVCGSLLLLGVFFLSSCGSSSGKNPCTTCSSGTPPGTYTLTVAAASGSITESMPLTLTVQ